jgi:hypothetical protein
MATNFLPNGHKLPSLELKAILNRHPMVEFFIKKGDLCLYPFDDVKVYFDSSDRVSRWTVATYQTGC